MILLPSLLLLLLGNIECFPRFELPSISNLVGYAKKAFETVAQPYTLLTDEAVKYVEDFTIHKARVQHANHFLGPFFAERFDAFLKNKQRHESWIPSAVQLTDGIEVVKSATDSVANTVVTKGILRLEGDAIEFFGGPIGGLINKLMHDETYLWYFHQIGNVLGFYYFPVGATNTLLVVALKYAMTNRHMVQQAFLSVCSTGRLAAINMRNNAIYVANEMTAENLPSILLDEFIMRNRSLLLEAKWGEQALRKIIRFKDDTFVEYYFVLVRRFPHLAYGKGNPVAKVFSGGKQPVKDAIIIMSPLVGLFEDPFHEDYRRLLVKVLTSKAVGHDTFLAIEMYLSRLEVIETATKNSRADKDLMDALRFLAHIVLPGKESVQYVIERGLYSLTALSLLFPPTEKDPEWDASKIVAYTVRKGTPSTMIAALKFASLPPSFAYGALELHLPRIPGDGADRSQKLVFAAFLSILDDPIVVHSLGRPFEFRDAAVMMEDMPMTALPVNLTFLEDFTRERPLSRHEMHQLASAVANLKLDIPPHISARVQRVGLSLTETINKMLREYCGLMADPSIIVTSAGEDSNNLLQVTPYRDAPIWQAVNLPTMPSDGTRKRAPNAPHRYRHRHRPYLAKVPTWYP